MEKIKLLDHFTLVEYNGVPYPEGYTADIHEVAGHLDKDSIEVTGPYSLHTEYSYGKRKLDSVFINKFPELVSANKDGVPQLWKSIEWANEFADFIIELTRDRIPPTIVEVHPPFNDYCTMVDFAARFEVFEKKVHAIYPNTQILIENRAGTVYRGGKFLVGKAKEIVALCEAIEAHNLNLGIVLDFPQLLTAENIDPIKFKAEKYLAAVRAIDPWKSHIKGIHIWGKKKSATDRWVAHAGNLNTYFGGSDEVKELFLSGIRQICEDGTLRFLVPEVNTGSEDLVSIIHDLNNTFSE